MTTPAALVGPQTHSHLEDGVPNAVEGRSVPHCGLWLTVPLATVRKRFCLPYALVALFGPGSEQWSVKKGSAFVRASKGLWEAGA